MKSAASPCLTRYAVGALSVGFLAMLAGCGDAYRATVGTGNPVPVSSEPEILPVVISLSGTVQNNAVVLDSGEGQATIFDLAGDTSQVFVNVGVQPEGLFLSNGGGTAYIVNLGTQDATTGSYIGSVSSFGVALNTPNASVATTTLDGSSAEVFAQPSTAPTTPCDADALQPPIFANSSLIYVGQTTSPSGTTAGTLLPLSRVISGTGVPALMTPVATAGIITSFAGLSNSSRTFAIERDANEVDAIDLTSSTTPQPYVSAQLTGFTSPTFGITSPNGHRTFILNCNGTVSVIDSQANTILQSVPTIPLQASGPVPAGNPIWADYWNAGSMLVTANSNGDATQGTVSVINAEESSSNFGQVLGTAVVGVNPAGISVLQNSVGNGSTAYVVNEDIDPTNAAQVQCQCKTVSVVSLTSNTTIETIPLTFSDSSLSVSCPVGPPLPGYAAHPAQIVASPDSVDQKVYVLCDQPYETDPQSGTGIYYMFSIRTYADVGATGGSSNANTVVAAIPIAGIPSQLKMLPAR